MRRRMDLPRWFLFYAICIVLPSLAKGIVRTDSSWVSCSGETFVQNMTVEEALVRAKRRARLNAIERVCGIHLQAESLVKDFMTAGDFIHAISYGHVVAERNVEWNSRSVPADGAGSPPIILVRVTMEACVVPVRERPDPAFRVNLRLNRSAFEAGDEVVMSVTPTKDCYITILNLAANDSVYLIFPNPVCQDPFVGASEDLVFPDISLRESGFHVRVAPLPGHEENTEIVKVIATRREIVFPDDIRFSESEGYLGTPGMAVTRLARWLSEIPVSERTEASALYTVREKD